MGFKQNTREEFKIWRKDHAQKLVLCGIPEFIVNDNNLFWYVIQHGDYNFDGKSWHYKELSNKQAKDLLCLLIGIVGQNSDLDLVTNLEMKFGLRDDFSSSTSYDLDLEMKA